MPLVTTRCFEHEIGVVSVGVLASSSQWGVRTADPAVCGMGEYGVAGIAIVHLLICRPDYGVGADERCA